MIHGYGRSSLLHEDSILRLNTPARRKERVKEKEDKREGTGSLFLDAESNY
jgi:hypothetical protein